MEIISTSNGAKNQENSILQRANLEDQVFLQEEKKEDVISANQEDIIKKIAGNYLN